ncbi:SGNH/GDSL hydrolase family protein [Saccharothrix longispora]|uniref:SGNH/GDSL hydrolase family protein n=1 Tax=Saccharothrix longispora TaxID=33920 RepID=UPI0028FD5B1D|nr:SGNH/GDSL hydrolase family protein [Saccharothrix longispora]MBY8850597.1 SGNH/GDSL hydrolase family protein [Saccharothrix sp. MB29]MDU0288854.1 SGNH/GDSL hydrolase family protein [Saccharothrix longispora]
MLKRSLAAAAAALLLLSTPQASAAPPTPPRTSWAGAWATSPTTVPASDTTSFEDQTLRQVVHLSVGGDTLRVRLSNEFGTRPLVIGEAHVARRAGPAAGIDPRSDRRLTFGGRASVTVPPGAPLLSDPVALPVAADSDLVVSIHLPRRTRADTVHAFPYQDGYVAAGNVTGHADPTPTAVLGKWHFLTGVAVTGRRAATVVAFGDSITDGAETTRNANRRWPDVLARRFQADRGLRHLGVVNAGISGNRLLHDPNPPAGHPAEGYANYFGQAALRRFDRDVLAQPGADHVVVLLGVNDLGHPGTSAPLSEKVSAQDVIDAHRQLIARAHAQGLRVHGGTITPFKGDSFGFFSPENEAARQTVNRWIRTSGEHDGVIDFDRAVRDPRDPERLLAAYDSGDHLHPNDAGMAAMANAVPLRLFR